MFHSWSDIDFNFTVNIFPPRIVCPSFAVYLSALCCISVISPFFHEDVIALFLLIQLYEKFGGFNCMDMYMYICVVFSNMYGNLECFSQTESIFKTLVVLSALSCLLNCIPLVVAGRLFEECSLALAFKPTIHIPLCKLNMKPKSRNDFPACIFLLL